MKKYPLLALGILVALVLPYVASADQSDTTSSFVSDSSAGYWDRFGHSHPSVHLRSQCERKSASGWLTTKPNCADTVNNWGPGDWATDFYASPGTTVKFKHYDNGSSYTAKVWNIAPTCSAGSSAGGWTVFVDLWVNGTWEGWVAYGHLNNVQVQPDQVLNQDQTLGYLKRWDYLADCWEVNNDAGVHTHTEEYNRYRYACYTNYSSGTYLSYGSILGTVGRMIYTNIRQPC